VKSENKERLSREQLQAWEQFGYGMFIHFGMSTYLGEVWVDIPAILTRDYKNRLYSDIRKWQPETAIVMNHGIGNGSELNIDKAWPTDIITIERFLPDSMAYHQKVRTIEGHEYYLPGEVCDPIGKDWFYTPDDQLRSDAELLGMYLVTRARGANLLLDVPPDKHGLLPIPTVDSLMRLRKQIDSVGG